MPLITPLDIQNKELKRSIRGYDVKEVDIFLDEIIEDYEKIYKENIELKDKLNSLAEQIRHFNTMEETLKNTLIAAQTTADDITSSARLKAENIIENAEISGDKLIELAKEDVRTLNQKFEFLRQDMFSFGTKFQAFMQAQQNALDNFIGEINDYERNNSSSNNNLVDKDPS